MLLPYLAITPTLISCAGPMSPFGAHNPFTAKNVEYFTHDQEDALRDLSSQRVAKIEFYPSHMNYHDKGNVQIKITSPVKLTEKSKFQIFYNNLNVTSDVVKKSHVEISADRKEYLVTIPRIKLPAHKGHNVSVRFIGKDFILEKEYPRPTCRLDKLNPIVDTYPFNVKKSFISSLQNYGKQKELNPSLMAGLIAKESGFNTKAVSWAKAIGLTQITELAESHVLDQYKNWPEYPGLDDYSVATIKTLIKLGKVNENNEWRLNKRYSILGGISYIRYIESYWDRYPEHIARFGLTDLVLASYNSGPYRVRREIEKLGDSWLQSNQLNEARKYVKMVKSYCYHFSNGERYL